MLQQEYRFLQRKYALKTIHQPIHFLRMRPGNFPTLRLAQLAALVTNSTHLFSTIKESTALNDIHQLFDCTANDYWHYHYRLDEQTNFKKKKLGKDMIDSIIINTVVPVLFAYGHYYNEIKYKDKALQWLEETAAEANSITKGFQQLSVENKTAFDSQALIELKLSYCDKKMCLNCGLGNSILKA